MPQGYQVNYLLIFFVHSPSDLSCLSRNILNLSKLVKPGKISVWKHFLEELKFKGKALLYNIASRFPSFGSGKRIHWSQNNKTIIRQENWGSTVLISIQADTLSYIEAEVIRFEENKKYTYLAFHITTENKGHFFRKIVFPKFFIPLFCHLGKGKQWLQITFLKIEFRNGIFEP